MLEKKIITLRNVYGKMKECHLQPTKQSNGMNWDFVKRVNKDGEMVLNNTELNDPAAQYFIPEDMDIVITDGTTFDLNNPLQNNMWKAIRDSELIAPTRDARNENGDLVIDGNKKRYGIAEFYVDIPGEDSERAVSKKMKITKAWTYIENDSASARLTKCKLLGKDMRYAATPEVTEYLYDRAERNPDEIIDLYTSGDIALRLLIIDAREKGIIIKKDGMFMYSTTPLGSTEEAILLSFKVPSNKRVLDAIKFETYPEYASEVKDAYTSPAITVTEVEEPVKTRVYEKPANVLTIEDLEPAKIAKTSKSIKKA